MSKLVAVEAILGAFQAERDIARGEPGARCTSRRPIRAQAAAPSPPPIASRLPIFWSLVQTLINFKSNPCAVGAQPNRKRR